MGGRKGFAVKRPKEKTREGREFWFLDRCGGKRKCFVLFMFILAP